MPKARIQVDAGNQQGELAHNWTYIGFDECNYTYIPESLELLAKFQQFQEQPYYLRTHHLFCTGNCHGFYKWGSTNVYMEDEQGSPVYNWKYIDLIFDTILQYGCKPFVELGFMPQDLVDPHYLDKFLKATGFANDYKSYQQHGWACPPKDYDKWYGLIYAFVTHCLERYGAAELLTWYFELWNEPDIRYWQGSFDDFNKLYDYTAAAVKAACPQARVGGPGVTNPAYEKNSGKMMAYFFDHTRNGVNYATGMTGTPVDFTSFHVKGGGYPMNLKAGKAEPPSVRRIMEGIQVGYEILREYGYENLECILTEIDPDGWAAGGAYDNPNLNFRNTEYYPSFVADAFDKASKFAKTRAWDLRFLSWAYLFPGERAFEGTRVFSTQGIDKPVLNLFRMYARMGRKQIALQSSAEKDPLLYMDMIGSNETADISGFASLADDQRVDILIYNHHDNWDLVEDWLVEVELRNLPVDAQRYTLSHYRIDAVHSNAYAEWLNQGQPMYPDAAQKQAIQARAGLELLAPPEIITTNAGKLSISFSLPVHGISLLSLTPVF